MRSVIDALVLAWVVVWILAGLAVGREVRGLAELSDNAEQAGLAAERAADVLDAVPLIGDEPAEALRDVGASTIRGAERGRERARTAGTLLGLAIAIVPSLPLLVFYLPGRRTLERDRRAIREALAAGDPHLEELLASRAVAHLPLARLHAITPDPIGDLQQGRHGALAEAELSRLGLARAR